MPIGSKPGYQAEFLILPRLRRDGCPLMPRCARDARPCRGAAHPLLPPGGPPRDLPGNRSLPSPRRVVPL